MDRLENYKRKATQSFQPPADCVCERHATDIYEDVTKKAFCVPCKTSKTLLKFSKSNAKRSIKRCEMTSELAQTKLQLHNSRIAEAHALQKQEEANMETAYYLERLEESETLISELKQRIQRDQDLQLELRGASALRVIEREEETGVENPVATNITTSLFVAPSHYCTTKSRASVGDGLYCPLPINKGDFLQEYKGDEKSLDTAGYKQLLTEYGGKPEYLIHLCADPKRFGHILYLDCYRTAQIGECLASKANCLRNLEPMDKSIPKARGNCEFRVHNRRVRLYSTLNVEAYRELICTGYGKSFTTNPNTKLNSSPGTTKKRVAKK